MSNTPSDVRPPRIAVWLLKSFCSYDYLSTALWDLEELFDYDLSTKGPLKAKWLYLTEALSIIYHLYLKGNSQYSLNFFAMFKNNIIIALRNFKKHKSYALLNVLGLISGLTIFLLITLYTSYEFSYDTYHAKSDRIYRIYKKVNGLEELYLDSGTPGPLAAALVDEYPEVESAARFIKWRNQLIASNGHTFVEPAIHAVDPEVFDIFSLKLLHGNQDQILTEGPHIAVSESVALKYFGRTDVVNEAIIYNDEIPLQITSVYEDMPANSHFIMDIIVNFDWTIKAFNQNVTNWNSNPYYTYVLLKENSDPAALIAKFPSIREKYAGDPMDEDGQLYTYYLQPLSEVHFADYINGSLGEIADADRLTVFNIIALIVLLMAAINYINLSTARAIVRFKETGIRKIMGADRLNLLGQFLIESGILVFFSLAVALLSTYLLLPVFSFITDRPLSIDFIDPFFWLQMLGLGLLIMLASGLYPALLMSSFNPLYAITQRGFFKNKSYVRNVLVVLQFCLSAILIISALVLQSQLSFIETVDTGYTREQVMILNSQDETIDEKLSVYMEKLTNVPGVEAVATSWSLPTNVTSNTQANWPGIDESEKIELYMLGVTHGFFDLYEIELADGRSFDPEIATDKTAIILNEAAVEAFGWTDPVGREMIRQDGTTGTVIGVTKNFHIKSLREKIEPLQIVLNPNYATLAVRISGDVVSTMAEIEEVYNSFQPSYPFEYRYFDDIYDSAYIEDTRTGQLTLLFSLLAIIIACLGLYGLASHKVTHRIKELGVRKVLGASAFNIAQLLFKEFLLLIGIAFLIAGPVAYLFLNKWLEDYAYHIELGALPFAIALLILLAFAALTVGYRTWRASVTSPVHALRDE